MKSELGALERKQCPLCDGIYLVPTEARSSPTYCVNLRLHR